MMKAFHSLQGLAEHRQVLMRATAGFRDGRRLRGLNSWKEGAQQRRRQTTLVRRGCAALVSSGSRKAYLTWRVHAQTQARVQLLRRGATAMTSRRLSMGFNGWLDATETRALRMRRLRVAAGEWRGASFREPGSRGPLATGQRAGCVASSTASASATRAARQRVGLRHRRACRVARACGVASPRSSPSCATSVAPSSRSLTRRVDGSGVCGDGRVP